MDTNDLIAYYKTPANAQRQLGISRQLFHYWKRVGISPGWQAEIQLRTKGKLKRESA